MDGFAAMSLSEYAEMVIPGEPRRCETLYGIHDALDSLSYLLLLGGPDNGDVTKSG